MKPISKESKKWRTGGKEGRRGKEEERREERKEGKKEERVDGWMKRKEGRKKTVTNLKKSNGQEPFVFHISLFRMCLSRAQFLRNQITECVEQESECKRLSEGMVLLAAFIL